MLFNIAVQPSITASFTQSSMDVDYIRIYQETPVGIVENKIKNSLNIFPNPVNDELTIQVNSYTQKNTTVNIYTIEGKLIRTFNSIIQNNQVKINSLYFLNNGLYFITIELDGQLHNSKFLKQ